MTCCAAVRHNQICVSNSQYRETQCALYRSGETQHSAVLMSFREFAIGCRWSCFNCKPLDFNDLRSSLLMFHDVIGQFCMQEGLR